uniref:Haloacid Dehalogenase superfamily, subfamily IB, phosphoserine phosphatase-like n=1 Tax=Candidatus Kentrum sp. TC TaxID=2126339 RepID=A0A450ZEG3_9GAMM|nr:MAG: Haloacid Dehalogenase superfamily, subfamily IB, phosphoserine phosphatase-like [Candidatus Kentron sp. TC]
MNTVVIADFDETLIEQNTLLNLYRILTDTPLALGVALAFVKGRWLRRGPRAAIKEEMYRRMLRGKSESDLAAAGREIAHRVTLNQPVVSRIRQLSAQGHDLLVASAALTPIVRTILEEKGLPFSRIVASRAEIEEEKLTGNLVGLECFGKEKARRLTHVLDTFYSNPHVIAFGNWPDDGPMLAGADEAYVVEGNNMVKLASNRPKPGHARNSNDTISGDCGDDKDQRSQCDRS